MAPRQDRVLIGFGFLALLACSVVGPMRAARPPVTYCRDVAPIMQTYCQDCHRGGGIAPFPLETYQDARAWAEYIQDDVQGRAMPPWPAAEDYGEFQHVRRLTDAQLATIAGWVNAGAPEGDPRELPPLRPFINGWDLGVPDLVLDPGAPYPLHLNGRDEYRNFVLPFSPTKELWVAALEVSPGAPSVVHHVSLYLDPSGKSPALDRADPGPGLAVAGTGDGFSPAIRLADWGPGTTPWFLPRGAAWKIPAHARLVMQIHYHVHEHDHGPPLPESKPERDRTRIGLYLARGPVDKRVRTGVVENSRFQIPPGADRCEVTANRRLPRDITVLAVIPHMRLLGREMKVSATLPGGIARPLVWITDWDFDWGLTYTLKKPLKLPRGSRIDLVASYDNSAHNHENPSYPPKLVGPGSRATDEVCVCSFLYTVDAEHLTRSQPLDDDGIELRK